MTRFGQPPPGFTGPPPSMPPQQPGQWQQAPKPPPSATPPPPADPEEADRIEKLALYVSRNGAQFEQVTREKNRGNPKFGFLEPMHPCHLYYQHVLNCMLNGGWSIEQIQQARGQDASQSAVTTFMVPLDPEEQQKFTSLMAELNGARDVITGSSAWIVSKHRKGVSIMVGLRRRAQQLHSSMAMAAHKHILYLLYVINDILFRASRPPYIALRDMVLPQLPTILRCAKDTAQSEEEISKLQKMASMWVEKGVYDAAQAATLLDAVHSSSPVPRAPSPPVQQQPPPPPFAPPPPRHQHALGQVPSGFPPPLLPRGVPPPGLGPPPPLVPTAPVAAVDLAEVSVGAMVGLVKAAMKNGHKSYTPIATELIPAINPPVVEPARLEARVNEYYRSRRGNDDEGEDRRRGRDRGRSTENDRDRSRERDWGSRDRDRERDREWERERRTPSEDRWVNDRFDRPSIPSFRAESSSKDRHIEEDNVGYEMLKGMGWKEGSGLGASGSGRAEPIRDDGQMNKGGLGSSSGSLEDTFAQFREMRSDTYHKRLSDRATT